MEEAEATQFLESLLGKTLHVTVPDGKATHPVSYTTNHNKETRTTLHRYFPVYG